MPDISCARCHWLVMAASFNAVRKLEQTMDLKLATLNRGSNELNINKRLIIYILSIIILWLGHSYTLSIPMETFRYVRQSLMSMICLVCFTGAFVLMKQKKGVRADKIFSFILMAAGVTNLGSLIRGLVAGYAGMVEYKYLSLPMLLYGSIYAYFFLLYPIEAFRPGWLTLKRSLLLLLPTLVIMAIYLIATSIFNVTSPIIDNWSTLMDELDNITVWLKLSILFYPLFGLVVMIRYRGNYREWCENNFASMENIDVKWLEHYIFSNMIITISCLVVVFSNDVRSVLMHNFIFLLFFLYAFYRVYFRRNPYPEGFFRVEGSWSKNGLEPMGPLSESITGEENDKLKRSIFMIRLPEYTARLEEWMENEKPYLRKDFKLTDAMEILPLNRSYLSRLFNEGYGESFYHFVMRYRLAESRQLLISRPELSITAVASMAGFSSASVFCRAFTQEMKCSPLQWREKELASFATARE
ncbi:AraC-type DNA-binding protein [Porphyromonadaceae bacterium KHP3R9]|nr:AraC-type DNA-binding protein [Porphyromonadaceae bacterium KHP3R9]